MNHKVMVINAGIGAIVASQLVNRDYDVIVVDELEIEPESIHYLKIHDYEIARQPSCRDYKSPEDWQKKNKRWKSK